MQYKLKTPVTREGLAPLKAGDTVLLSGTVYTARDAAHKRMMERLDAGEPLPFPVEGSAVYYVMWAPPRSARARSSAPPAPPPAAGWTPTPPGFWTWASSL